MLSNKLKRKLNMKSESTSGSSSPSQSPNMFYSNSYSNLKEDMVPNSPETISGSISNTSSPVLSEGHGSPDLNGTSTKSGTGKSLKHKTSRLLKKSPLLKDSIMESFANSSISDRLKMTKSPPSPKISISGPQNFKHLYHMDTSSNDPGSVASADAAPPIPTAVPTSSGSGISSNSYKPSPASMTSSLFSEDYQACPQTPGTPASGAVTNNNSGTANSAGSLGVNNNASNTTTRMDKIRNKASNSTMRTSLSNSVNSVFDKSFIRKSDGNRTSYSSTTANSSDIATNAKSNVIFESSQEKQISIDENSESQSTEESFLHEEISFANPFSKDSERVVYEKQDFSTKSRQNSTSSVLSTESSISNKSKRLLESDSKLESSHNVLRRNKFLNESTPAPKFTPPSLPPSLPPPSPANTHMSEDSTQTLVKPYVEKEDLSETSNTTAHTSLDSSHKQRSSSETNATKPSRVNTNLVPFAPADENRPTSPTESISSYPTTSFVTPKLSEMIQNESMDDEEFARPMNPRGIKKVKSLKNLKKSFNKHFQTVSLSKFRNGNDSNLSLGSDKSLTGFSPETETSNLTSSSINVLAQTSMANEPTSSETVPTVRSLASANIDLAATQHSIAKFEHNFNNNYSPDLQVASVDSKEVPPLNLKQAAGSAAATRSAATSDEDILNLNFDDGFEIDFDKEVEETFPNDEKDESEEKFNKSREILNSKINENLMFRTRNQESSEEENDKVDEIPLTMASKQTPRHDKRRSSVFIRQSWLKEEALAILRTQETPKETLGSTFVNASVALNETPNETETPEVSLIEESVRDFDLSPLTPNGSKKAEKLLNNSYDQYVLGKTVFSNALKANNSSIDVYSTNADSEISAIEDEMKSFVNGSISRRRSANDLQNIALLEVSKKSEGQSENDDEHRLQFIDNEEQTNEPVQISRPITSFHQRVGSQSSDIVKPLKLTLSNRSALLEIQSTENHRLSTSSINALIGVATTPTKKFGHGKSLSIASSVYSFGTQGAPSAANGENHHSRSSSLYNGEISDLKAVSQENLNFPPVQLEKEPVEVQPLLAAPKRKITVDRNSYLQFNFNKIEDFEAQFKSLNEVSEET